MYLMRPFYHKAPICVYQNQLRPIVDIGAALYYNPTQRVSAYTMIKERTPTMTSPEILLNKLGHHILELYCKRMWGWFTSGAVGPNGEPTNFTRRVEATVKGHLPALEKAFSPEIRERLGIPDDIKGINLIPYTGCSMLARFYLEAATQEGLRLNSFFAMVLATSGRVVLPEEILGLTLADKIQLLKNSLNHLATSTRNFLLDKRGGEVVWTEEANPDSEEYQPGPP